MPRTHARARRNTKDSLRLPLFILALLIVVASGLFIADYYMDKRRTLETNEKLLSMYDKPATAAPAQPPAPTPAAEPVAPPAPSPIVMAYPTPPGEINASFKALYETNPDIVGRLYLPSGTTPIELFVVQRDNEYYLNHDFYGARSDAGTLFLDEVNEIWPQDEHMLIYGHNMKNGTMFARLTKFDSIVYASRNPIGYFDTLYESGVYVAFAAMRLTEAQSMSDEFNIRSVLFSEDEFAVFVNAIRSRALYVTDVDVNYGDQLLSLITCSYNKDDERFIYIMRRLRQDENETDIRKLVSEK